MQAYLKLDHIDKTFVRGAATTEVLKDINLAIGKGEYVSIIGHSGCGKSTLLNIVAGLTGATAGGVLLEDREVNSPGPDRAVVFQNHSLLPWLTVYENVRLGVDKVFARTKSRAERDAWTMHNLNLVQMAHAKDKRPNEISGGMKQRVGIARALATRPNVLLSDEATSALDPQTTRAILDLLANINRELGVTIVLITHEMSVVRQLAKEVVVIDSGRIVERGHVADIFTHPRHPTTQTFLAEVLGDAVPVSLASRIEPQPVPAGQAVIRVQIRGTDAGDTIVARLVRELSADIAVLAARIDEIGGQHVGSLVLGIPGGEAASRQALFYLSQHNFAAERLGYVA